MKLRQLVALLALVVATAAQAAAGPSAPAFNSGTGFTAPGAPTKRSVAQRAADVVNVKDWGAKGDGTTDDTAALQAAVNAGAATGKPVVVAPGTYMVAAQMSGGAVGWDHITDSGGIKLPSNTHLVLQAGAVLKSIANGWYACNVLRVYNGANITVEGPGALMGDRTTHNFANPAIPGGRTTQEWCHVINVRGGTDVAIRGVTVTAAVGDAISVGGNEGASRVRIVGCRLDGSRRNNVSIIDLTSNILIEGNLISRAGYHDGLSDGTAPRAGIDIEGGVLSAGTAPSNVTVRGNILLLNTSLSISAYNASGTAIIGNTSDAPIGYAYSAGTTIIGNALQTTLVGSMPGIYGIAVAAGMDTNSASIVGNTIRGFAVGIDARGANVVVDGNHVYRPTSTGIKAYALTGGLVVNNQIFGAPTGILVDATATGTTVAGNTVEAATTVGVTSAGPKTLIRGNRVRSSVIGISVVGGDATVDGNELRPEGVASESYQMLVQNGATVARVTRNIILGAAYHALLATGNPAVSIVGNWVTGTTATNGVTVTSTAPVVVNDNDVSFNRTGVGGYGISLTAGTTGARVLGNRVYSETTYALSATIKTDTSAGANKVYGNVTQGALTLHASDVSGGNTAY